MVIAFIPARGGSKSIPLKNIKLLCGRPLIQWVLLALDKAQGVDKIIVATDSQDIMDVASTAVSDKIEIYHRSPENAQDTSPTESVMLEYIAHAGLSDDNIFVLVQATSPFTRAEDFDAALKAYASGSCDSLLSVTRSKRFFWDSSGCPVNYDYQARPRRQDFDGLLMENGAFYINSIGNIKKHGNRLSGTIGFYEMPEYTGLELDEPHDWTVAEQYMKNYHDGNHAQARFITDVDGGLTDAGMYCSEMGEEQNMTAATLEDLWNTILDLERKYNLLHETIAGVCIWQAAREPLYYRLSNRLKLFGNHQTKKNSLLDRLCALPSFITSSVFYNPLLSRKQRDILIFDHRRKVPVDGRYIDIYTHYLIEDLAHQNINYEVFEKHYHNRHFTQKDPRRRYMDFIQICATLYAKLRRAPFTRTEKELITAVENELRSQLNVSFNLTDFFARMISIFKAYYYFYHKILSVKKPHTVYLPLGTWNPDLIKAAKDLGIETIAIQHGTISEYHPGYHYPDTGKGELEYFPDKIHLWDDSWKTMCVYPVDESRLIVTGFEHLKRGVQKYENITKNPRQITVISQWAIGPQLAETIHDHIHELLDYTVRYKLHPDEHIRRKEYAPLMELKKHLNVHVIDNYDTPLYQLFAESKFVIGVFSTALFEAMYFGCVPIVCELPGHECMKIPIKRGDVKLLKKGASIISLLK